jgi:hypothetical protein
MPPSAPRVSRLRGSGYPAGFLSFSSRSYHLMIKFINSIDFVADEDVVDVADWGGE